MTEPRPRPRARLRARLRTRVGRLPLTRELTVLSLAAFATAIGIGILAPTLPLLARDFGVSNTGAAAVVSAFALARLVCGAVMVRLAHRADTRRVMLWGLAVLAVSSALAGWATSYPVLLSLRIAGGVGSAMFSVSGMALVTRHAPATARARATGVYIGALLLGTALGPAAGIPFAGISLRAKLFCYAVLAALSFLLVLIGLPRGDASRPAEQGTARKRTPLRQFLRGRPYLVVLTLNFAVTWCLGVRGSLIPLHMVENLGESASLVGWVLFSSAVFNILLLPLGGRISDREGWRPVLLTGCALAALGLLTTAAVPQLWALFLGLILFGAGAGILEPPSGAVLAEVSRDGDTTPVALHSTAGDLGMILGPLAMGALADGLSFTWAFAVTTAVMAAPLLLALGPGGREGDERRTGARK